MLILSNLCPSSTKFCLIGPPGYKLCRAPGLCDVLKLRIHFIWRWKLAWAPGVIRGNCERLHNTIVSGLRSEKCAAVLEFGLHWLQQLLLLLLLLLLLSHRSVWCELYSLWFLSTQFGDLDNSGVGSCELWGSATAAGQAFIVDDVKTEVDIDIPLSSHHWGEQVLYYYYLFVWNINITSTTRREGRHGWEV